MDDRGPSATSLSRDLYERADARDIGLFIGVALALLLVHVSGPRIQAALIFHTANPTIATGFTTHYLHASTAHLLGNLLVYVGAIGLGYPLALLGGIRRVYLTVVVGILVAFPFVLTALHMAVIGSGSLVGFSGLALALVATLPVTLFAYLKHRFEMRVSMHDTPVLFFFGIAAISWQATPSTSSVLPLLLIALGLGLLYLGTLSLRLLRNRPVIIGYRPRRGEVELPIASVLLYFLAITVAFPTDPVISADQMTNLVIHLFGFTLGFISTYLTERSLAVLTPDPPPPPPPPRE